MPKRQNAGIGAHLISSAAELKSALAEYNTVIPRFEGKTALREEIDVAIATTRRVIIAYNSEIASIGLGNTAYCFGSAKAAMDNAATAFTASEPSSSMSGISSQRCSLSL